MTSVPTSHLEEAVKLEADAYVDLFEIGLQGGGGTVYFKADNTVEWQGNTYEGIAIKMSQVSTQIDGSVSRPTLQIVNPEGAFSIFVVRGYLNKATIVRHRVLKQHIDGNDNIEIRQIWGVGRVSSLDKNQITLELKSYLDGPNALVPNRVFKPPEFPQVSLL
jgi:lambda family phage minor tail protein L